MACAACSVAARCALSCMSRSRSASSASRRVVSALSDGPAGGDTADGGGMPAEVPVTTSDAVRCPASSPEVGPDIIVGDLGCADDGGDADKGVGGCAPGAAAPNTNGPGAPGPLAIGPGTMRAEVFGRAGGGPDAADPDAADPDAADPDADAPDAGGPDGGGRDAGGPDVDGPDAGPGADSPGNDCPIPDGPDAYWAVSNSRAARLLRRASRIGVEKRMAGHLPRNRNAHEIEDSRGDVGEATILDRVGRAIHHQYRHRIGGVRGMRATGRRVLHQLAIAVVGGDQQRASLMLQRRDEAAQTGVHRFHRLDRGGQDAGVPDHVP